jgi:hypothetical protein
VTFGEFERDGRSQLVEDVKAAQRIWKVLAPSSTATCEVVAAERGRRQHPDGTVEVYERLEFRRP